jgi:hypothetical protein
MRLKEFDLDLPNADRDTRNGFRLRTRCVSSLYERVFPGLDVDGGWKVLIECVERVSRDESRNLLGVFTLQVPFDYDSFAQAEATAQKALVLDALHKGVLRIADSHRWPLEPFEIARESVVAAGYANEWRWPEPKWNRQRSYCAFLGCHHDVDRFSAWLVVQDRNHTAVQRVLIISELPDEFFFAPKMGKLKWTSNDRVALFAKNGEEVGALLHSEHDGSWKAELVRT